MYRVKVEAEFKFLIGRLKRLTYEEKVALELLFKFLIGRLKQLKKVFCIAGLQSLNSSLAD